MHQQAECGLACEDAADSDVISQLHLFDSMSNFFPLQFLASTLTFLIGGGMVASSSREIPINRQHISGLNVTGGRLFAGSNTTNNIYNSGCSLF